ncbi:MAG: integrin alpha [Roseobacter sp.]
MSDTISEPFPTLLSNSIFAEAADEFQFEETTESLNAEAVTEDLRQVSNTLLEFYDENWFRLGAKNDDTDLLQDQDAKITAVNHAPLEEGIWFAGSDGGEFRVFAGGVFDFRNQGTALGPGDTTSFTHTSAEAGALIETSVKVMFTDAQDDHYSLGESVLAAAGSKWLRLGAKNDATGLLANDDDNVEAVVSINGQPIKEGVWFDGSGGGQFRVFSGGVVDFRNQGEPLTAGATTEFTYGVLQNGVMGSATVSLTNEPSSGPVRIKGIDQYDRSGVSVSSAGDVDGDGLADVLIGAYNADRNGKFDAGESYLLYGAALTAADGEIDLATLSASEGVLIKGIDAGDFSGFSVSSAGDVDGDGLADVIIGAYGANRSAQNLIGESYLLYGAALAAANGEIDLARLSASEGVLIRGGDRRDYVGWSVSSAGDVDGDGLADVIIGEHTRHFGQSYLLYGAALTAADGEIDLATLSASEGVRIRGIDENDGSSFSVSSAGDVDGDGLADVLVGAPRADPDGKSEAGESYLLFGAALTAAEGVFNLSEGVLIKGRSGYDFSGWTVSSAGDVDGDGLADVLIGAHNADRDGKLNTGESYLLYGAALTAADGEIDLATLSASEGVLIKGIDQYDISGHSISSAGDVDGDGLADVLIGVRLADPDGTIDAGESYILYGADLAAEKAGDGVFDLADWFL